MIILFGLNDSRGFAEAIAKELDIRLADHDEKVFGDSELYVRSKENVRGADVYVISSLYGDSEKTVSEKFMTLAFFVGALNDASAGRITVVAPYLAYSRQDRKTESRAPITTKYAAKLLEAAGVDRLMTMDVHNIAAFQNAFRIQTDNLEAKNLLVDHLSQLAEFKTIGQNLAVLSPDSGGMTRAKRFRDALEHKLGRHNQIDVAYLDKERVSGTTVHGNKIIGDVKNRSVVILDDMIASGSTIKLSADAIVAHGGSVFAACATHGLFVGNSAENLNGIRVIVTDTVPPWRLKDTSNVDVISTSRMFARAIGRCHNEGGSISELLQQP